MKRFLIITTILLVVKAGFSYPITPQPLRKLIKNSEYIIIATVDNPTKPGDTTSYIDKETGDTVTIIESNFSGDGVANLDIKEVLKGNISSPEITVNYEAGLICPTPASYPDKKTVLAFLTKEDTSETYSTYGLSYGSKIMKNDKELKVYKDRITDFIDISNIWWKRKRKLATVEWLVKCAENKYTRWEGVYELSRSRKSNSRYDQSKVEDFSEHLTKEQKTRLEQAFFSTDTVGQDELLLANFVEKSNYPEMKQHLLKNLTFADYYIVDEIMAKVIDINPNNKLKEILKKVEGIDYNDKEKESKQEKLIDQFIELAKQE